MFADIMTIISKELNRVFTDKKLVFTTFFLPAISLVLIYSVMGIMMKNTMTDREDHVGTVVVIQAPESFKQFISKKGSDYNLNFKYDEKASEPQFKDDIYNGDLEAMIVFDNGFDVAVTSYKNSAQMPNVLTYYNPTEDYSGAVHNRLSDKIFVDYEKSLLVNRFGDETFLSAFTIDQGNEEQQLAPPEKISGDLLGGLVPMLLSIFLFAGGMGIGIDLITGEKERGTMATMLVTPIRREAIAFGKMISLSIISLVSTSSSLVGMAISFPFLTMGFNGSEEAVSGTTSGAMKIFMLSPTGVFQFFVLAMMLTLIYVGLICIISVYANSIKEAGTLITPAYMVVMLLGVVTLFSTELPKISTFAVPVYGTLMGMKYALSAELTWGMFGMNMLVSAVIVAGIVWLIKQMFNSEKIMFGA